MPANFELLVTEQCVHHQHPAEDDACFDKESSSTMSNKRKSHLLEEEDECPTSPTPPSLISEASCDFPSNKRRKQASHGRRVSFQQVDSCWKTFEKEYTEDTAGEIWWSESDLKKIKKREGKLVLNLKDCSTRAPSSSSSPSSSNTNALDLKQSIAEAFKRCVDQPLAVESCPPVVEVVEGGDQATTTRGLERYISPLMGAHKEMVIKSLLCAQKQLSDVDPSLRSQVLCARYHHLSKISTNFAIALAEKDAQIAANL
jgi:hypothetical protein